MTDSNIVASIELSLAHGLLPGQTAVGFQTSATLSLLPMASGVATCACISDLLREFVVGRLRRRTPHRPGTFVDEYCLQIPFIIVRSMNGQVQVVVRKTHGRF